MNACADECPDDTITFNFDQLEVKMAFAIFADHAGLTPDIDQSIAYKGRIVLRCVQQGRKFPRPAQRL